MPQIGLGETQATISTNVPQPYECQPVPFNIESIYELADGSTAKDLWATRARWELDFRGMTQAEWGRLLFYFGRPRTFWFRDFGGNQYEVMSVGDLPSPTLLGNFEEGQQASITLEWVGSNSLDSSYFGLFTFDQSAFDGGHAFASGLDTPLIFDESAVGRGTFG